jgi:DNA polymerase elongation subunit (family B)
MEPFNYTKHSDLGQLKFGRRNDYLIGDEQEDSEIFYVFDAVNDTADGYVLVLVASTSRGRKVAFRINDCKPTLHILPRDDEKYSYVKKYLDSRPNRKVDFDGKPYKYYISEKRKGFIVTCNTLEQRDDMAKSLHVYADVGGNANHSSYPHQVASRYGINLSGWNKITNYNTHDTNIYHGCDVYNVSIKNIKAHKMNTFVKPTLCMFWDIETSTETITDKAPEPDDPKSEVFMISVLFSWGDSKIFRRICLSTLNYPSKFYDTDKVSYHDVEFVICKNMFSLLVAFSHLLGEMKPDFELGFSTFKYDWPFVLSKSEKFVFSMPPNKNITTVRDFLRYNLCIYKDFNRFTNYSENIRCDRKGRKRVLKVSADNSYESQFPEYPGIINIDLRFHFVRESMKEQYGSQNLNLFLTENGLPPKVDMPIKDMDVIFLIDKHLGIQSDYEAVIDDKIRNNMKIWRNRQVSKMHPGTLNRLMDKKLEVFIYCVYDSEATFNLFKKVRLLLNIEEMSQANDVTVRNVVLSPTSHKVISNVRKQAEADGYVLDEGYKPSSGLTKQVDKIYTKTFESIRDAKAAFNNEIINIIKDMSAKDSSISLRYNICGSLDKFIDNIKQDINPVAREIITYYKVLKDECLGAHDIVPKLINNMYDTLVSDSSDHFRIIRANKFRTMCNSINKKHTNNRYDTNNRLSYEESMYKDIAKVKEHFSNVRKEKYDGAWVHQITPNHTYIGDLVCGDVDVSAEYPSVQIAFNISPETCIKTQEEYEMYKALGYEIKEMVFRYGPAFLQPNERKPMHAYFLQYRKHKLNSDGYLTDELIDSNELPEACTTTDGRRFVGIGIYPKVLLKLKEDRTKFRRVADSLKSFCNAVSETEFTRFEDSPLFHKRNNLPEELFELKNDNSIRVFEYAEWLQKQYDLKQNIRKIIMNTVYGVSGNMNLALSILEVAGSTTSSARDLTSNIRDIALNLGFTIVYGDTDSVYVVHKDNIQPDLDIRIEWMINKMLWLRDRVNESLKQKTYSQHVSVTFEKCMYPIFLIGRKNYIGLEHKEKPQTDIFKSKSLDEFVKIAYVGDKDKKRLPQMISKGTFYNKSTIPFVKNIVQEVIYNIMIKGISIEESIKSSIFNSQNRKYLDSDMKMFGKQAQYKEKTGKMIKSLVDELKELDSMHPLCGIVIPIEGIRFKYYYTNRPVDYFDKTKGKHRSIVIEDNYYNDQYREIIGKKSLQPNIDEYLETSLSSLARLLAFQHGFYEDEFLSLINNADTQDYKDLYKTQLKGVKDKLKETYLIKNGKKSNILRALDRFGQDKTLEDDFGRKVIEFCLEYDDGKVLYKQFNLYLEQTRRTLKLSDPCNCSRAPLFIANELNQKISILHKSLSNYRGLGDKMFPVEACDSIISLCYEYIYSGFIPPRKSLRQNSSRGQTKNTSKVFTDFDKASKLFF